MLERPHLATEHEMIRWNNEGIIEKDYYYTTKQAVEILWSETQYLRDLTSKGKFPWYKIRPRTGNFYLGRDLLTFYVPRPVNVRN